MPEAQKLTGITQCPDCMPTTGEPRHTVDHEAIRQAAVELMVARRKGEAKQMLRDVGMAATHLWADCPFLGRIAHLRFGCFPGDRLHLQSVIFQQTLFSLP